GCRQGSIRSTRFVHAPQPRAHSMRPYERIKCVVPRTGTLPHNPPCRGACTRPTARQKQQTLLVPDDPYIPGSPLSLPGESGVGGERGLRPAPGLHDVRVREERGWPVVLDVGVPEEGARVRAPVDLVLLLGAEILDLRHRLLALVDVELAALLIKQRLEV